MNYAKTSIGRAGPPALQHVSLMRDTMPSSVGVKFSGFGTLNAPELALHAFALGADLIGSPCGDRVVDVLTSRYAGLHFDMGTI